jgi:hypothetical protein
VSFLDNNVVFGFWFGGPSKMSSARLQALLKINLRLGVPFLLITENNVASFQVAGHPFHPALPYLSATHKSDYLRMYFLHHYGGGYTDLKPPSGNWIESMNVFRSSKALIAGYSESRPTGVAQLPGVLGDDLRKNYDRILSVCCLLAKPNTEFTSQWLLEVIQKLDDKFDSLARSPASHVADYFGKILDNGGPSSYPFKWTELLGDILHPLMLRYLPQIAYVPIKPEQVEYR